MGIPIAFKADEFTPVLFERFTWKKPEGVENCDDAESIRSKKTGYTAVKIKLRPDEVKQVVESGEVYVVLCAQRISPFWVGAHRHDAMNLLEEELK